MKTDPQAEAQAIVAAEGDDVEWFHPDNVVRMIATALAAKNADLATLVSKIDQIANEAAEDVELERNLRLAAEAQLASANEALGRIAKILPGSMSDDNPTTATNRLTAAVEIARQALEEIKKGGDDGL